MASGDEGLALSDLIQRLQDDEAATVCAAAAELGQRGTLAAGAIVDLAKAWGRVTDFCGDDQCAVAAAVEAAIQEIGSKATAWLLTAIGDKEFPADLILMLCQRGVFDDPCAALVCALRKALRGESRDDTRFSPFTVVSYCAEELGKCADDRAVPILVQALAEQEYENITGAPDVCLKEFCSIIGALEATGPAAASAMPYLLHILECEVKDVLAGRWLYAEGAFHGIYAPSCNIGSLLVRIGRHAESAIPYLVALHGLVSEFYPPTPEQELVDEYQACACGFIADTVRKLGCGLALHAVSNLPAGEIRHRAFEDLFDIFDTSHEMGCMVLLKTAASLEATGRDTVLQEIALFVGPELLATACTHEDESIRAVARLALAHEALHRTGSTRLEEDFQTAAESEAPDEVLQQPLPADGTENATTEPNPEASESDVVSDEAWEALRDLLGLGTPLSSRETESEEDQRQEPGELQSVEVDTSEEEPDSRSSLPQLGTLAVFPNDDEFGRVQRELQSYKRGLDEWEKVGSPDGRVREFIKRAEERLCNGE